ncbi:hypothetical protein HMPREF9716_01453 [Myroides odoratus CIP 103059]|nr:hypothetical protein HMPREF9716_01453 [Myroides odoratus CIP 103059]
MGQWQLAFLHDTYRIVVKYGDNESIVRANGNWPYRRIHIVSLHPPQKSKEAKQQKSPKKGLIYYVISKSWVLFIISDIAYPLRNK